MPGVEPQIAPRLDARDLLDPLGEAVVVPVQGLRGVVLDDAGGDPHIVARDRPRDIPEQRARVDVDIRLRRQRAAGVEQRVGGADVEPVDAGDPARVDQGARPNDGAGAMQPRALEIDVVPRREDK